MKQTQRVRKEGSRPSLPAPPLSEAELAALYRECNRTRFAGRLSPAIVEWQDPPRALVASTHPWSALGPSIWISPLWPVGKDRAWVRQVLLHEMCHVEVGTGADGVVPLEDREHGPRWRAAMLRLHEQAESWVLAEIDKMDQSETGKTKILEPILRAMDGLDRSLPLAQVYQLLVRRLGRRRGRHFGYSAADLILRDIRVIQHCSELRRQESAARDGQD